MIKKMNKMLRNKKGFTLVELIVVIAVLGILAGIAVPKYSGMKAKAYQAVDEETVMNLSHAMELYYAEHNEYPQDTTAATEAAKLVYDKLPDIEQTDYKTNGKFYVDKTDGTVQIKTTKGGNDVEITIP